MKELKKKEKKKELSSLNKTKIENVTKKEKMGYRKKFKSLPIEINGEEGFIDEFGHSELGFLMVKIYFPNKKQWISYNLGEWSKSDNFIVKMIKSKWD